MFRLVRYISVTSAVALLAVALALTMLYRRTAQEQLLRDTQHESAFLTRSIANAIWTRHAHHVATASHQPPDQLIYRAETWQLHEDLRPLLEELPILKVKIYDIGGLTVYSSNLGEIGQTVAENPQFIAMASQGEPATEIYHGRSLEAIPGFVEDRCIVESYLPIRGSGGMIDGVFELYIDVTGQVAEIERTSNILLIGLLGMFALLYGGLVFVVRRADRAVTRQYERVERKNRRLSQEMARRKRTEIALRIARDDAEAASRAKSRFLASMSHELRTPLNAIIGFSQVMEDGILGPVSPPRYREYAGDIRASGHHLLSMVNNVLDMAKAEAGRIGIKTELFNVPALARSAARTVEADCRANGNRLSVSCDDEIADMAADEGKLRAILINLLGNAAKFTRDGTIQLAVKRETVEGGDWVVFQVSDTGCGIPNGEIEAMFGEFVQGTAMVPGHVGGSGLGLAISRRFAEMMGGRLELSSELGKGTVASLRLPDMRTSAEEPDDLFKAAE